MIRAEYKDKEKIVKTLATSIDNNRSVNYIIKQDKKRIERIKKLMEYFFEVCYLSGYIFLSNNKDGCALIVLPGKKKTTIISVMLDLKLIFFGIGISKVKKVIAREARISEVQPKVPMYYLWFIGAEPGGQNKGLEVVCLPLFIMNSILIIIFSFWKERSINSFILCWYSNT